MTLEDLRIRLLALEQWKSEATSVIQELTDLAQRDRDNCWCQFDQPCDTCQWLEEVVKKSRGLDSD